MTPDEAIEALRTAWPERGCGAGDCCLRRPGGQVVGTCRCVRDWKDRPGVQPVYCLLDAARRVVEAPHEPPPSLDAALAVLVDRAATQAESGTGEVARPLREAVARLLPSMRIATGWGEDMGWINRYGPDGAVVAAVSMDDEFDAYALNERPRRFGDPDEAQAWCDEVLTAAGWVLL